MKGWTKCELKIVEVRKRTLDGNPSTAPRRSSPSTPSTRILSVLILASACRVSSSSVQVLADSTLVVLVVQRHDLQSRSQPQRDRPARNRRSNERNGTMGFRAWFRRFVSKVKDILGIYKKWDDYVAEAFFEDGGRAKYTGKPWGSEFDQFKSVAERYAWSVTMNMTSNFWRFE